MDEPAEAEIAAESLEVPPPPGERLRRAREAAGMSLQQVAAETRIPQRHLKLIEAGDFAALPARTSAIGFSKNFAKAVGLDDRGAIEQGRRGDLVRVRLGDAVPVVRTVWREGKRVA